MAIKLTLEQQAAVQKTDGRICVAAGAGSGKTRVLVERIIALLEEKKATPRQLLAVTFTNKAAGEMKERLRARVEERLAEAGTQPEKAQWETTLDELPLAMIGTIHAFCGKVLRSHPVESGLDPSFRVADEAEAMLVVREALDNTLEGALRRKEPAVMQLCAAFRYRAVRERLLALWREKHRLPKALVRRDDVWFADNEKRLTASIGEAWTLLQQSVTTKKQTEELERLLVGEPSMAAMVAALWQDERAAAAMLGRLQVFSASGKIKAPLQDLRAALAEAKMVWAERKSEAAASLFLALLERVDSAVRERRKLENVLFFDDLEQEAIALLETNADVRRQWQQRFRYVMVDEFQDTNKTQLRLLNLLDGEQQNGNFFFVGDDKQSIYRFRGAQVEVFRQEHDCLPQERQLRLVKNFRSAPDVLRNVNDFFQALYEAAEEHTFIPLVAGRDEAGQAATACYLIDAQQDSKKAEADWIAAELRRLVASRSVCVEGRPAGYGDCALLFRSGQRMSLFAQSLRAAGVPYQIVGSSGFYEQQEVRDMLMLLGVLDNRLRELELAGVLRSPLFGLTDETLLLLAQTGPLWVAVQNADEHPWLSGSQQILVRRAAALLSGLQAALRFDSPQKLGELILAQTQADVWLAYGLRGAEASANVDKLFAMMAQYCRDTGSGVSRFLAYVEQCRSVEVREELAQADNCEAVQLMTIHKAKGLEFPIVVLPEMDARFPAKTPEVLADAAGHIGFSVRLGDEWVASWTHQQLAEQNKDDEKAEAMRVLYVAMTRAKERLLLTGGKPKKWSAEYRDALREKSPAQATAWLDWLLAYWPNGVVEACAETAAVTDAPVAAAEVLTGVACDWQSAYPLAAPLPLDRRQPLIELSATALQSYRLCPRWFYYQHRMRMPECRREAAAASGATNVKDALAIGNLAHRVLELVVGGRPLPAALAEAGSRAPESRQHEALVMEMTTRFLASESGAWLQRGVAQAEVPFCFDWPLPDGRKLRFVGAVDCLIRRPDARYTILDYKTNLLFDDRHAQEKASAYEHQLMLYTLAVEAAFGEVAEAVLCFLRTGANVPIPIADERDRLVGAILADGQAIADGETEADFPVRLQHCQICPFNGFCRQT